LFRREIQKFPYDVHRTRVEFTGTDCHWEVTTIDLKKFYETPFGSVFAPLGEISGHDHGFETLVYKTCERKSKKRKKALDLEKVKSLESILLETSEGKKSEDDFYFLQAYHSVEEAHFGHEELVQSILNGQFFCKEFYGEEDPELSEFLFFPDFGEDFSGEEVKVVLRESGGKKKSSKKPDPNIH